MMKKQQLRILQYQKIKYLPRSADIVLASLQVLLTFFFREHMHKKWCWIPKGLDPVDFIRLFHYKKVNLVLC